MEREQFSYPQTLVLLYVLGALCAMGQRGKLLKGLIALLLGFFNEEELMKHIFFGIVVSSCVLFSAKSDPVEPVPVPNPGFGEYSFLNCNKVRRIGNHELRESLVVNFITTQSKKPYAIRGTYTFYNTGFGNHGYSQLVGNISGRYIDFESGFANISLYNGKEFTNTEGFLGQFDLYSVGFGESLQYAGYATSNSFSPQKYVTGCRVSNLQLYYAIP
jgi:hypothetical protein